MFDKLSSIEHLYNSFLIAYRGRHKTRDVIEYKQDLENNLLKLRTNIFNFTYKHKKYKTFIVKDSKKRIINAPSFEDHILHHAVFSLLEEVFEKKFIYHSYANRKNKGSHKAILRLQKISKTYNWYLKMDITKYFQSVDQKTLFEQILRYVKDDKFLFYIKMIIESYSEKIQTFHLFFNDLTPFFSRKGMPIGNVTSQLFANIYLHDLDFYVENTLKPLIRNFDRDIFYARYVDDFIILSKNKEDLILIRKEILKFIKENLKLIVLPKKMILNKIICGIPFLGYNILTSKKIKIVSRIGESNCCHIILKDRLKVRNDTIKRFKKKIKNYSDERKINSLISFKGHCDLANYGLISKLTKNSLSKVTLKEYKYKSFVSILCMEQSRGAVKRSSQEEQSRELP